MKAPQTAISKGFQQRYKYTFVHYSTRKGNRKVIEIIERDMDDPRDIEAERERIRREREEWEDEQADFLYEYEWEMNR